MASLDSANGPSATTRPFLPETILPSRSSGFPATALPCSISLLNQAIQRSETCCISSGERPLCQSVPRKISMYPFFVSVLIILFWLLVDDFRPFHNTTNGKLQSGQLFRLLIHFP